MSGLAQARKIVVINDTSVARGGATKLALELAVGVKKAGREVTYFCGDDANGARPGDEGIDIVSVGGKRLLDARAAGFVNGLYFRKAKTDLEKLIEQHDALDTIYHVHGWAQILSPSIFAALRPVAARTVVTAHDFFYACPNGNFTDYPRSRQCELAPMSLSCIGSNCDKRSYPQKLWRVARQANLNRLVDFKSAPYTVLVIQDGMVPFLERGGVPRHRIRTMTNPGEKLFGTRIEAERNKEVIFLGRIEHEKGADLAAAAAHEAGLLFRVIGEGPAQQSVRDANPEAQFEGWCDKGQVAGFLKNARLLVMPSRCTEPFGLSAAEAIRIGVPVVCSKSSLIAQDLERLGAGQSVDVFNAAEFAQMLGELKDDDARVKSMSRAAFAHAGELSQSYEAWLSAQLAIYDELVTAA